MRSQPSLLAVVLLLTMTSIHIPFHAVAQDSVEEARKDDELPPQITRITVRSHDGHIETSDVLAGLAQAKGLDDQAIRHLLPSGTIDLTRASSRLTIMGLDLAMSPGVRLRITPSDSGDPALVILIDRDALQDRTRDLKSSLRSRMDRRRGTRSRTQFGLSLSDGWEQSPPKLPLVIVIHGFAASSRQVATLASAIGDSGLPTGIFAYPNDQPIYDSAEVLAAELYELQREHPQRPLALVTHSMGGLVARAMIENPQLDPGNVKRLIMIAPPNHGSQLAELGNVVDFWEHLLSPSEQVRVSRFYAGIEDGLGEAAADLQPDSKFLRELNSRPLNPDVKYTILLGTRGVLTQRELDVARSALASASGENELMQVLRPRFDEFLSDLDEVIIGKGDGVVAVKRGRLEGVDDTLLMSFSHLGVIPSRATDLDPEVLDAIIERLAP